MPPRKRARNSTANVRNSSTPTREPQPKSETPATSHLPSKYSEYAEALSTAQSDPWTDEEETLLLKSLVKWKPTGLHKHFRMLAIFDSFRSHGYTGSSRGQTPAHLRIPGIWAKLYTLYDLDALDQRENAHAGFSGDSSSNDEDDEEEEADVEGEDEDGPKFPREFVLPGAENAEEDTEFSALMWKARLANEADEDFDKPEIIKGLSSTRSLPGVTLQGMESEVKSGGVDEEEVEESGDGEEAQDVEDSDKEEAEEEEEEEEEESAEQEEDSEQEEDEEDEEEQQQEVAKPVKKAAPPLKRGRPAKSTRGKPSTRSRGRRGK